MTNMTDTTSLLDEFNNLHTRAYIPAMVYLVVVIIAGLVSNLFAFLFYTWRAPKSVIHSFISILSLNDAVTNITLIHDVVGLWYTVKYTSPVACKFFFAVKHWLVGNSLVLILVMAFDRYELVCRPHGKQLTKRMGEYVVLGSIIFSLFISVHYLATSEIIAVNFPTEFNVTMTGYHCVLAKQGVLFDVADVFHKLDICIHALAILSMTVAYILIIKKIVHVKQKLRSHDILSHQMSHTTKDTTEQTNDSFASDNDTIGNECNINTNRNTETHQVTDTDNNPHVVGNGKHVECTTKQAKLNPSVFHLTGPELKLSIMAFVITVASVLCFVPYYVSMLNEPNVDGKNILYTVGIVIARRSYILNSAVNPFIMMYFNPSFRQYVRGSLCCVRCRIACFKHDHNEHRV